MLSAQGAGSGPALRRETARDSEVMRKLKSPDRRGGLGTKSHSRHSACDAQRRETVFGDRRAAWLRCDEWYLGGAGRQKETGSVMMGAHYLANNNRTKHKKGAVTEEVYCVRKFYFILCRICPLFYFTVGLEPQEPAQNEPVHSLPHGFMCRWCFASLSLAPRCVCYLHLSF